MPSALPILTGENNPVLRAKSKEIPVMTKDVKKLIEKMQVTVRAANGVGLAAPQVGQNIRLIIAQISGTFLPMINPEILEFSESTEVGEEGCLSLPDQWGKVARAKEITLVFLNEKGEPQKLHLKGMDARVVQHEIDHLDGILFLDRLETKNMAQFAKEKLTM